MTSAFDGIAGRYDDTFTHTALGGRLRDAVWTRTDRRFSLGSSIIELNCGTGEDALHLAQRGVSVLATDGSVEMVELARHKVDQAGGASRVRFAELDLEGWSARGVAEIRRNLGLDSARVFDGALSNFGGLNCVGDLSGVAAGLAGLLRPGAVAILCLMGRYVPWEWGWFLARGEVQPAFRRVRGRATWRGLTIRYPSIAAVRRAFRPYFRVDRLAALGALLPPPYAEEWAARHPRAIDHLDRWERRLETMFPLPWLADHYLMELERTPELDG